MSDSTLAALKVILGADTSDYEKGLSAASKAAFKMSDDLKQVGEQLTEKITLPMMAAAAAAIYMATEQQVTASIMVNTLAGMGISYDNVRAQVDTLLHSMEALGGYSGNEMDAAFTNLLQVTGNYQAALVALPAAVDLARGRNLDLEQSAQMVGRAFDGQTTALKRMGVQIVAGSKGLNAIAQIQKQFAGDAAAYSQTAAGAWARLVAVTKDAATAWGQLLLPMAIKVYQVLTTVMLVVEKAAGWFNSLNPAVKGVAAGLVIFLMALGPVLVAIGTLMTFLGPITVALGGLAAAFSISGIIAGLTTVMTSLWGVVAALAAAFWEIIVPALAIAAAALFIYANWQNLKNMWMVYVDLMALSLVQLVKYLSYVLQALLGLTNFIPAVRNAFNSLREVTDQWSSGLQTNMDKSASKVQGFGKMFTNTSDVVKSALASLGKEFSILPTKTQQATNQALGFFDRWSASMQATSETLGKNIAMAFSTMTTDMVMSLVEGTGSAGDLLLSFCIKTLDMILAWAISNMTIAATLSEALSQAMENPYVAAAIIVGLIALIAGLSASFHSSVHMAQGGMTDGLTLATLGDNPSGQEVVLPLDSPKTTSALATAFGKAGHWNGADNKPTEHLTDSGNAYSKNAAWGQPDKLRSSMHLEVPVSINGKEIIRIIRDASFSGDLVLSERSIRKGRN